MPNSRVHCLFEQSGTFKNEFKKLGYDAYDYDILNDFGQTDYQIDLYNEIDKAYDNKPSIFDNILENDLIMAFFPCVRFEAQILLWFRGQCASQRKWDIKRKLEYNMKLHAELHRLYMLITKLALIVIERKLKLIIENPYNTQHYLLRYWCIKPAIIDLDRSKMGDNWKKPTQYWFINCKPQNNKIQIPKYNKKIKTNYHNNKGFERNLIDKDYALNFINKYIGDL